MCTYTLVIDEQGKVAVVRYCPLHDDPVRLGPSSCRIRLHKS